MSKAATGPFSNRNSGYRGHIAELDAIRAIGIGLVLLNHFWPVSLSTAIFELGQTGWIAMDAFFVLSGFLITGILLDTRSRPDYFQTYYTRRSLRIFPLYYLVLAAIILMSLLSRDGAGHEYSNVVHTWGSPAWFAFYMGNFKLASVGRFPPVAAYGPLWSLQIEEQFYLLFPLAVRWLQPNQLTRMLWFMVFLSPLFRVLFFIWNPNNPFPQFALLPCHMEGIALGALIAMRLRGGPWEISKTRLAALTIGLLLIVVIGSILSVPWGTNGAAFSKFARLAGISLSSWGCAGLILWLIQLRGSRYTRILRTAPLRYVAKISYGIYLLHQLASRGVRWTGRFGVHLDPHGFLYFAAVVAMSLAMASISWHLLERPLLSLKDRLAPRHATGRVGDRLAPRRATGRVSVGA